MTTLDAWRTRLRSDLMMFASLAKEDRSIDLIFGITAAAVLWRVRNAPSDDVQKAALREACGDDTHLAHLLEALSGWDEFTPLEASRALSKRQSNDDTLRESLTVLMGAFVEVLLAEKMLQTQTITIEGSVHGANINIGGYQVFTGETIIQYTRPVVSTCPTAPKPPDHFTGREQELRDLREKLTGDNVVAITAVRAMGGMGKTTLAQALCHQPDKPFDAVLWASLGENPQVNSILLEWARYAADNYTLKPDAKPEEIAGWVRGQLTKLMHRSDGCGERWLVVFDDVWNKPTSYAAIELLQTALPAGIKTLITTRQVDTASYLRATSIELYELSSKDALTLLQRRRDNRHLTDAHLQRAVNIIMGHPLTLEIAIASLNNAEDANDISAILDEYERGIRDGSPFDALNLDVETPRILNVVFGRSYYALPADDQARFRALGIMPPGAIWNRRLAGSLWDVEEQRALTQAHKTLRLASFIQQDETAEHKFGEAYYRQHPLLRAYARALLNRVGVDDLVFKRYTDFVIRQVKQFNYLPLEEWAQLDPLRSHLECVGDALGARYESANMPDVSLLKHVTDFAYEVANYVVNRPKFVRSERGKDLRGLRWLEAGLSISQQSHDHKCTARLCNLIGLAWNSLGEYHKALDFFQQALSLSREIGDKCSEAAHLNNIAGAWLGIGDTYKALNFYQQASLLVAENYNKSDEAHILINFGGALLRLDQKYKALEFFTKALSLSDEIGNMMMKAEALARVGSTWYALGERRKALDFHNQVLELRRALGDKSGEATTLRTIGVIWSTLGEKRTALELLDRALLLFHGEENELEEAITLNRSGDIWNELNEKHKALDFYDQALQLFRREGDKATEAILCHNIGRTWYALGEVRKALDFYNQALPFFRGTGDKSSEATTLNNSGLAWSELGEARKALGFYNQALPLFRDLGDKSGEGTTLNNIGLAWSELGEARKALGFYNLALPLRHEAGDKSGEATTLNNIGSAWEELGEARKALGFYFRALLLRREVGDKSGEATTLFNMSALVEDTQRATAMVQHEVIEGLIAQIATAIQTSSSAQSTLPDEAIQHLASNTYAVMTSHSVKHSEWREHLQRVREAFEDNGDDYQIEVAFAVALLSILDGGSPKLPDSNPYSGVIQSVLGKIEKHKEDKGS